ncbi:MAG: alanine--glyoxylate aminotransferase family protein [Candidatus Omnitrophota bacterium]
MRKYRLMSPGPTTVPPKTLLRMSEGIIHHRTPGFKSVLKGVNAKLKGVFRTENPVLIFSSSGTGAMEAAVVNFLSKGDKALIIRGGKFGERFGDICRVYGVDTVPYDVRWGDAASASEVRKILEQNQEVKVVYGTLCETSTGVVNDIRSIAEVVSATDAVFAVDAISGLCADEFRPDEWGVDVAVSGSQKGLMLPPGLGFLSVSSKALKLAERSDLPKFYFDVKAALKSYGENDTPWTPAISLVMGLDTCLDMILEEGLDNVIARHASLAYATREAVKCMGLELLAKRPSNALTAVKAPEGMDAGILVRKMRDEQGITIAGGQADLKGRVFRIAHLGYMDAYDTITGLEALEIVLNQLGHEVSPGEGVSRAREILFNL